jgi:hypothetical protein
MDVHARFCLLSLYRDARKGSARPSFLLFCAGADAAGAKNINDEMLHFMITVSMLRVNANIVKNIGILGVYVKLSLSCREGYCNCPEGRIFMTVCPAVPHNNNGRLSVPEKTDKRPFEMYPALPFFPPTDKHDA